MTPSDTDRVLDECREELHRVVEENAQLRASANAFADLAERLSRALNERRVSHSDRRAAPRGVDRRAAAQRPQEPPGSTRSGEAEPDEP